MGNQRVCIALVLVCLFFGASRAVTDYHEYDFTQVRDGEGYPTDREGTVYGNVGGHEIYFAGGVNFMTLNRTQAFGFKDIYTYNTNTNTFVKANTQLPTGSFFGSGGILKRVLYIYSGASHAARGSNAYNFTYFTDLYSVDFTGGDLRSPVVNTIQLQPPVTPRVYSSGFVALNGVLYVFGGAAGPDAVDPVPDVFLSIDTATGKTTQLPCLEDNNCPKFSVINPVIFMNKAETKLYVYGGMHIDYTTFISHYLYSYDIAARRWNTPTHVQDGPQLVFNGWALNADVSNVLLIGGSFGRTGSHRSAWAWDLTVDPPTFQKLDTQLPYRCESAMVGIDGRGTAWVYSGSVYETAASSDPLSYNHGVLMLSPPASDRTASAYLLNIVIAIATLAIIGGIVAFLFWKNKVSFRRNYEVIPG